jgi:hypothetical protein
VLAAFAPFFGALNWLLIPIAIVGVVVSAIVTGKALRAQGGRVRQDSSAAASLPSSGSFV